MQTIVFNDYAGGYFELYRGGAVVSGDKIIGEDKYNRFTTHERDRKNYVVPFYLLPRASIDRFSSTEDEKVMFKFLNIDYDYVVENRRNGKELKIPISKNFKCVFTTNGEIVIYDGDETLDPIRKTKKVKTLCKWYKEWGKRYYFYQSIGENSDGIEIKGWVFKPGSKYVICSSFHFLDDLKYKLIPEYFVGELDKLYKIHYEPQYWKKANEMLYNTDPIDLNESWDWTDEEKAAIAEAERLKQEEAERKRIELETRKNTPGYCRFCGAEHAEYIPFEEMYLCRDCYYDMRY